MYRPSLDRDYLAPGAPFEINIDSKTMDITVENMKHPDMYVSFRFVHVYVPK